MIWLIPPSTQTRSRLLVHQPATQRVQQAIYSLTSTAQYFRQVEAMRHTYHTDVYLRVYATQKSTTTICILEYRGPTLNIIVSLNSILYHIRSTEKQTTLFR
jgi:hypothetical protein